MTGLRALLAALLLLAAAGLQAAGELQPVPPLHGRVSDLTGSLDPATQADLEQKLRDFETRKGSQVAVLIVASTQPETIEAYGIRVAEQWKLGRARVDDGAILLVAKDDRAVRIEVGYGLEGVLNDATAKRIISETLVPRFQAGDLAGGVRAGVDRILAVIDGEPLPPPPRPAARGSADSLGHLLPVGLLLSLAVGGLLRALLGRLPGALVTGGLLGAAAWLMSGALAVALLAAVIGFVFTLVGGLGRGGIWIGGSGGGFGGGGFGGGGSGGGFSGGGGGFGGGGASGRW